MKIAHFSTAEHDRQAFLRTHHAPHTFTFLKDRLSLETVNAACQHDAVCCFVNDDLSRDVINKLASWRVRHILLRCAGYDRVDLETAKREGITVTRVPAYSPESVAEHAITLTLAAVRRLRQSFQRQDAQCYSLAGLTGSTIHGKTVGIAGYGKIGRIAADVYRALGAEVIIYDPYVRDVETVPFEELLKRSDVISLHMPLTEETKYLMGERSFGLVKPGLTLVNTARGGLVDTKALLEAISTGKVAHYAADVYENEQGIFFRPVIDPKDDPLYSRLHDNPAVTITGHQAFLTEEATGEIARIVIENANAVSRYAHTPNELT